jgi:hypothetical protein
MPGKTAKSAPLPPFGLSGMTALVRAATLSCENAGKSQKCTQDRESSGESRKERLSNGGGINWLRMRRIHLDRRPLYGYGKISSADWS